MIAGEQRAGSPQATLDFVSHHEHVVTVANLPDAPQVALRRDDHTRFPLDRLEQKRYRVGRDRRFQGFGVAVGNHHEPRRERPEILAVGFF